MLNWLRPLVFGITGASIAGMVGGSIADNNIGAVVTCGLVGNGAMVVLIAVTYATTYAPVAVTASGFDEALGVELEAHVEALVASGGDERKIRSLVGLAVRFGRSGPHAR